ncbi:Uncharacterized protein dnl_45780 [Desulfonema limicola]|uniref:Uncharacterized protein n=1 Tax=Desulfonema limicola TaxID=45656 RepID=A0A975BBI5_9BACT|nr:hypothetical protein [Desulfonema limicola]QTA82205.1 Uncharacterized protein dnl_45780 [Desulfonema limicola]
MKHFKHFFSLLIILLLSIPYTTFAAPTMNVTFESGSGIHNANSTFEGFISQTVDPTGPFSGQSVCFKGKDEDTGQYMTFRYRINFSEVVNLKEVILQGVAFCGGSKLKLLDGNMNEIARTYMWGGNRFQTFLLVIPNGVTGSTFFLEEEDDCPNWRYRSNIKIIINDEPVILKKVDWWNNYIVHGEKEDGTILRWTGFEIHNENGERITDNVVSSIKLFDPDGIEVTPFELNSEPYQTMNGKYVSDTGKWEYDNTFNTYSGEYYLYFNNIPLKTGIYKLQIVDTDGNSHQSYNYCKGPVELPIISSDTFRGYEDNLGNFIWTWSVPFDSIKNIETQIRAIIKIYNNETFVSDVYINLPTHLGKVFIPNDTFQKIKAEGNIYKFVIQLREKSNRTREYSKEIGIDQLLPPGYSDINGDGKTGLVEAIHCLKVVSGMK